LFKPTPIIAAPNKSGRSAMALPSQKRQVRGKKDVIRFGSRLSQFGQHLRAAFCVAPDKQHAVAATGELQRHRPSDSARSARHQTDPLPRSSRTIFEFHNKSPIFIDDLIFQKR